jgi:hypothetical protein
MSQKKRRYKCHPYLKNYRMEPLRPFANASPKKKTKTVAAMDIEFDLRAGFRLEIMSLDQRRSGMQRTTQTARRQPMKRIETFEKKEQGQESTARTTGDAQSSRNFAHAEKKAKSRATTRSGERRMHYNSDGRAA